MKIQKNKYIFIAILAFLTTACGSSGGGGGGPSQTTPPTSNNPANPGGEIKPDIDNNKPDTGNPDNDNNIPGNGNDGNTGGDNSNNGGGTTTPHDGTYTENVNITNSSGQGLETKDKDIISKGTITTNQPIDTNLNAVPILAKNGFTATNEGSVIGKNTSNKNIMYGTMGIDGGNLKNTGKIELSGQNIVGMSVNSSNTTNNTISAVNSGSIDLAIKENLNTTNGRFSVNLVGIEGVGNKNGSFSLTNSGDINIDSSKYTHSVNDNTNLDSFKSIGISLTTLAENTKNHTIVNSGTITAKGQKSIGIFANGKNISVTNNGSISTTGNNSNGIEIIGDNNSVINKGSITTDGFQSIGINVTAKGTYINDTNGVINTNGNSSVGIRAEGDSINVINKGNIKVSGDSATGILVKGNSKGINDTTGTITVGDKGYGMYAESGGTIENKGKIILTGGATGSTGMYATGQGSLIINSGEIILKGNTDSTFAIHAENGSKYINSGKIIGTNNVEITGNNLSQFIVGTKGDGTVGTVRAKKISIDGRVVASNSLIKSNKNYVAYSDVFIAPEIEITKEDTSEAVSLFYNSKLKKNVLGNVDIEVYRNGNTVANSYKSKEFNSLITQLDRYLNTNNLAPTSDELLLSDKILKSNSIMDVQKTVKDISGEIYTNLPRQIFDIQERFLKEDRKLMNTLDYHSYNFNFFGDKKTTKDKGAISGYESRSAGFVGVKRADDNVYGAIGYEHNNIKYNEGSKGNIQTIHTGIYKNLLVNEFDINLGLRADYSFHETTRSIKQFGRTAKVKQNTSYTLGMNSEISKIYGDTSNIYVQPTAAFDLTYGKYDGFKEKNAGDLGVSVAGEDYLSILPSIGFKVGKNFQNLNLYSNILYSYELGNLDKKQNMSLLNRKINYSLSSDTLKKDNISANIGLETKIKDINMSFEIGKEFGKRENNYFKLGAGYKF